MRKLAVVVAAVAGLLGAACQPEPLTISFTVDRKVVVEWERLPWDPSRFETRIQMSGYAHCTRSEPLDVWATFTQYDYDSGRTIVQGASEISIPCDEEMRRWTGVWSITGPEPFPNPEYGFDADRNARLEAHACTNPGDSIDEDCVTVERWVEVVAGDVPGGAATTAT